MPHDTPTILGIESSCDETAAAVVRGGREVLANVVASQDQLHSEYGGVVPEIASRAHIERILPVIDKTLRESRVDRREIDAIAVGHRPGLIGSLLVGVSAAKALAWAWSLPLIGVDHIAAHLHAAALDAPEALPFPALGLVVSGGHTSLFHMNSALDVEVIGRTIDDAIGEAYDKAAMILGLGYPGGPKVDRRASDPNADDRAHDFPIARLAKDSLDFSFSGLKTSLLYTVRGKPQGRGRNATFERSHEDLDEAAINDLCASFQRATSRAIILKLDRAIEQLSQKDATTPRALIMGGGVSANSRLRTEVTDWAGRHDIEIHIPQMKYCLDNAAMIAGLAALRYEAGEIDTLALSASPAGSL